MKTVSNAKRWRLIDEGGRLCQTFILYRRALIVSSLRCGRHGRALGFTGRGGGAAGLVELVEDAAVAEVVLLRLVPAAEGFVDGDQGQRRELGGVLLQRLGAPRAVVQLADH